MGHFLDLISSWGWKICKAGEIWNPCKDQVAGWSMDSWVWISHCCSQDKERAAESQIQRWSSEAVCM